MNFPKDELGKDENGNPLEGNGSSGTKSNGNWTERIKGKTPEEISGILSEQDKMIGKVRGENKNLKDIVTDSENYLEYDQEGRVISIKGEGKVGNGNGVTSDEVLDNFRKKFDEDPITAILEVGAISNSNLIKNQINPLKSLFLEKNSGERLKALAADIKAKGIDLGDRPSEIMAENKLKGLENGENIAISLALLEKMQPVLEKGETLDKIKSNPSPIGGGGAGAGKGDQGSNSDTFYDDFKNSLKTQQKSPFDMT